MSVPSSSRNRAKNRILTFIFSPSPPLPPALAAYLAGGVPLHADLARLGLHPVPEEEPVREKFSCPEKVLQHLRRLHHGDEAGGHPHHREGLLGGRFREDA